MRNGAYRLACLLLTLACGIGVWKIKSLILVTNRPEITNISTVTAPLGDQGVPVQQAEELQPSDFYLGDSRLDYNGYSIEKKTRKVRDDYGETRTMPRWIDVSHIEITKGKRVVAKLDTELYFGLGNSVDFGLFPFLGGKTEQLFISQDIPRGGCQWVVSLSPQFRIIFDGDKYAVGREGYDLGVIDVDKDGIYEITVPLTDFYGFQNLSTAATPLPTIIFKYNAKARAYLQANRQYRDYLLRDIEKQKAEISPTQDPLNNHLGNVMSITLDFIFAGEEKKAWAFFDESYKLADKKRIKAEIKATIKDHPVYRFIYKNSNQ